MACWSKRGPIFRLQSSLWSGLCRTPLAAQLKMALLSPLGSSNRASSKALILISIFLTRNKKSLYIWYSSSLYSKCLYSLSLYSSCLYCILQDNIRGMVEHIKICVRIYLLILHFTNPSSWKNDLERECLSAGTWTLRVTDGCNLFLSYNFFTTF